MHPAIIADVCGIFHGIVTFMLLQNSFPVWEDFNVKAGRLHSALRLIMICSIFSLVCLILCPVIYSVW